MEPATIITSIFSTADAIYSQVKVIRANKKQCARLADRIRLILEPLRTLKKNGNEHEGYARALLKLQKCLTASLEFTQEFGEKRWVKKVLLAGIYEQKFHDLNTELQEVASILQLGLVVKQLINPTEDKADQEEDFSEILSNQDQIINLQQQAQKELTDIKLTQSQQQKILQEQLATIKFQITQLNPRKTQVPQSSMDKRYLIHRYDLLFKEVIAEGTFGIIHRGKWREDEVAIKSIKQTDEMSRKNFEREVEVMSRLRNPHIVQFFGASLESGYGCLVMEYMAQGSLSHLIHTKKTVFSEAQKQKIALEIALGLQHLHGQGMLHKDLTSVNVLVNADGHAKLTDFHTTEVSSRSILSIYGDNQEVSQHTENIPPEIRERLPYTAAADIYGYGIILWELFTGQSLENKKNVQDPFLLPTSLNTDYANLIKGCLQPEPNKRLGLSEIISKLQQLTKGEANYTVPKVVVETSLPVVSVPRPRADNSSADALRLCKEGARCEKKGDIKNAYSYYQQAAALDDPRGMCNLGMTILQGHGQATDTEGRGLSLLQQAADKGFPRAQYNLACFYERGSHVNKDLSHAAFWFNKAAAQNNKEAQEKMNSEPTYHSLLDNFNSLAFSSSSN